MIALGLEFDLGPLLERLDQMQRRADDISPASGAIVAEFLDQNRGIRLVKGHPKTVLVYEPPYTFRVGSLDPRYQKLINASPRYMIDVLVRWIVDGETR